MLKARLAPFYYTVEHACNVLVDPFKVPTSVQIVSECPRRGSYRVGRQASRVTSAQITAASKASQNTTYTKCNGCTATEIACALWRWLTYAVVCRRMIPYADVYSRILCTFADVFKVRALVDRRHYRFLQSPVCTRTLVIPQVIPCYPSKTRPLLKIKNHANATICRAYATERDSEYSPLLCVCVRGLTMLPHTHPGTHACKHALIEREIEGERPREGEME
jgi:hypothetical protein